MHLVVAGCVWRKRRVVMAEGAAIRRGLYDVVTDTYHSPAPTAVPFEPGLSSKGDDLRELPELDEIVAGIAPCIEYQ